MNQVELLKKITEDLRVDYKILAKKIGYDKCHVNRVLHGKNRLTPAFLSRIERAFKYKIKDVEEVKNILFKKDQNSC